MLPSIVNCVISDAVTNLFYRYYDLKKLSTQKAQKTADKTEQALKAAERVSDPPMELLSSLIV